MAIKETIVKKKGRKPGGKQERGGGQGAVRQQMCHVQCGKTGSHEPAKNQSAQKEWGIREGGERQGQVRTRASWTTERSQDVRFKNNPEKQGNGANGPGEDDPFS